MTKLSRPPIESMVTFHELNAETLPDLLAQTEKDWIPHRGSMSHIRTATPWQQQEHVVNFLTDAFQMRALWAVRWKESGFFSENDSLFPIKTRPVTRTDVVNAAMAHANHHWWDRAIRGLMYALNAETWDSAFNYLCDRLDAQWLEIEGLQMGAAEALGDAGEAQRAGAVHRMAGAVASNLSFDNSRLRASCFSLASESGEQSPRQALREALPAATYMAWKAESPERPSALVTAVAGSIERLGMRIDFKELEAWSSREQVEGTEDLKELEQRLLLAELLAKAALSKREAEVLQLTRDGLRRTEIAEKLGLASSTVRVTLHRAEEKLRVALSA